MIFEIIVLLLLSQLILGIYLWYQVKDVYKYPNLLGFPIIGNLYYFYNGYGGLSMETSYQYRLNIAKTYGDGMCFTFINGRRAVLLSCPHIIEKIAYNPNVSDKDRNIYGSPNGLLKGIFFYSLSDSEWKLRRKEINNYLNKNRIECEYHGEFVRITKDLVETMAANPQKVDLHYYLTFYTINIAKGTLFGIKELLPLSRKFYRAFNMLMHNTSRGLATPIYGFLFFNIAAILEVLFLSRIDSLQNQITGGLHRLKEIEKYSKEEYSNLPLSMVIALRNKKRNLKGHHMRLELSELIGTGSHTVAVTLQGALASLAVFPEIQEKAWQEQDEIFGTDTRDPTVEDMKKMSYLDRFLKETLRFFATPQIAKRTCGDINIGEAVIPAGTTVYFLLQKIHMDPRYWKNPQEFDPDRFLEEDSRPKYSFQPFGVGIRSCPGAHFAKNEMKVTLSGVLRRFKLSSTQKFEDFKFEKHLMVEISNLSYLQVEERKYFQ